MSASSDMAEEEDDDCLELASSRGLLECSRLWLDSTSIWPRSSELWEFRHRICSYEKMKYVRMYKFVYN